MRPRLRRDEPARRPPDRQRQDAHAGRRALRGHVRAADGAPHPARRGPARPLPRPAAAAARQLRLPQRAVLGVRRRHGRGARLAAAHERDSRQRRPSAARAGRGPRLVAGAHPARDAARAHQGAAPDGRALARGAECGGSAAQPARRGPRPLPRLRRDLLAHLGSDGLLLRLRGRARAQARGPAGRANRGPVDEGRRMHRRGVVLGVAL